MTYGKLTAVTLAAAFAIAAVVYRSNLDQSVSGDDHERMNKVLKSLLKQEKHPQVEPRVAVGYGACQDLFVPATAVVGAAAPDKPEHYNEIENEEQMLRMFAYFFRHGAAAERFVSDDDVFDGLVAKALEDKEHRWAVGGNAPVMALRFAREGAKVLLAAKMTSEMKRNLPASVEVASSKVVAKDDIHLILEYKREEKWGKYESPRANRFIVHSDVNNPTISSLEDFGDALPAFKPDLLIVSGLQMMDNFPFAEGERLQRLLAVQNQMKAQDEAETRIHFEMASFVDESLLGELTEHVIPYADSLGMNEQELPNLHSMLKDGNVSFVSDSNPRIATVLDEMRAVFELLKEKKEKSGGGRALTRLHVHTLAYQAIMTVKDSPWKNGRVAAAKASLTANRHVCANPEVDLEKAFIIMDDSFSVSAEEGAERIPFDSSKPIGCWTEEAVEVCVAPNLVCSEAKQTAGGGDNISAAGLYPQI